MRNRNLLVVALPSMAIGGLLTATLTSTAKADPATLQSVPLVAKANHAWEYRFSRDKAEVDRLGTDGWEAFSASPAGYYLKRAR